MKKSNSSNCLSSMSNSSSNNNSSQGATSGKLQYTESDDEGSAEYCEGGYHPVEINEIYNNRYRIEGKLGWGHFSTVWIATDLKSKPLKYVAIKIHKGAEMYADSAKCEISYLKTVKENSFDPAWVELKEFQREKLLHYNMTKGVVSLIDNFEHIGPNGTHVCMVFEFMGPNLLSLIKHYDYRGVPLNLVRKIATHVLIGLQYLHDVCKIIHSDVKPENVLVSPLNNIPKPREEKQEEEEKAKTKENNANENDKIIENDEEDNHFESNSDQDEDAEDAEDAEEEDGEDSSVTEIAEQLETIEWKTLNKKEKKKFKKKKKNFFKKERWKLDFPKKKQGKGKKENIKRECNVKNAAGDIIKNVKEKHENINHIPEVKNLYNNKNNNNSNNNSNCEEDEDTANVTNEKKINPNQEENEETEDLEKKIKQLEKEEEELKNKYGNYIPPYMKHKLKPRNSDPSLLTSYNNIHAFQESLLKKPYHYNNYFLYHPEKYGDSKLSMFLHRLPNDYVQKEKKKNSSECESEDDENLRNEINKFPMYCEMFNHLMHPEALKLHELYKKSSKNKGTDDMLNGITRIMNTHKMVFIETSEGPYRIRPYDSTVYYHEKSSYKICDLGNSLWIDESRFAEIQTRQYRSPEVILKCGFNETADIWSFACMVFELVTGDFLFNPQKGEGYDKNEEHLSSIMELLGDIPKHMIDNGYNAHKYFNKETYELRNITDIKRCELHKVLKYKYKIPDKEINPLCSFLLPMLSINPETRATASVMLQHPWLNMVTLEEEEEDDDDDLYINGRGEESISASSEEEEDIAIYQSEENNKRNFEELDHFDNSLNSSDHNLNHTPENSNIINYGNPNVYYSHNNFEKTKEYTSQEESEEEEILEYEAIQQQKKKNKKKISYEGMKKNPTTFYSNQSELCINKNGRIVGTRNHEDKKILSDINPQLGEDIIKLKEQKYGTKRDRKEVKKFNGISPLIGKKKVSLNELKNKSGISVSDDDDDDEEEEEEEKEDNGEDSDEDSDDEKSDDDSNENSDNDFDEDGEKYVKKKKEDKSEGDDEDEHKKYYNDKENDKEKNENKYTNDESQCTKSCKKGGLEKFKFTKFIKKSTEYVPNKNQPEYQYNQEEELVKREQENYFFAENQKDNKIKKKKICIFTKKINVFNE